MTLHKLQQCFCPHLCSRLSDNVTCTQVYKGVVHEGRIFTALELGVKECAQRPAENIQES